MEYSRHFKFLICAPAFDPADLEGQRLQAITEEIERDGYGVMKARKVDDAELVIQTDAAVGCVLLDWGKRGPQGKMAGLVTLIRKRGLDMPIIILVRHHRLEDIPVDVLREADGYVFLAEETPDFIAKNLISRLRQYAETLKTPFFGALVDYAEEGNQLWTCPGHNGGVFYARSPIGRIFFQHLGEAVFRDDLDNSVLDLGDLLTHEGPALAAQQEAAKIFGAERTYFVLNGTSSSNKIVLQSLVTEDDLVLFDRNNHKAAHHGALYLGGAIPVFLEADRNAHGLIGPIDYDALDEETIREKIRTHPLITDPEAWRRQRPFRVAVIEQCSYDGTIYSAQTIIEKLGPLCDYILFDEAWAGFMKFHPIYRGRFAMGLDGLGAGHPGIIATQSTHKQLSSFSQASQIHVKDSHIAGQRRRVEHRRFNEMFMMHASTSPFYPLFASLDVGAQMMKGRQGEVLWDDTIRLGIELRKKLRAITQEFEANETDPERGWFFDPFVPDTVEHDGVTTKWEDVPTNDLAADSRYWQLAPGAAWHGYRHVTPGYAMTDPNKLTLLTPGFDRQTGAYTEHGVPAPVVVQYLRENRIVAEKNDLNSILFLLTPGVESSKAGTLLSALVFFKRLHDDNVLLEEVIPEFVRRRPQRYGGMRLRDLCRQMHAFYRDQDTSGLQRRQFRPQHFPTLAMRPQEAVRRLVKNDVDYLPIDELSGRIATTLWVVYPPGIATIVPGERLDERAQPMIDYLKVFERGSNLFPGFENE
ncbi:MAG: ornithine decarboxylase, partial [Acetobacteraceae bacterium]|nr:ornithine decarboxylase [Acetobacteraceae bacterium]